MSVRDQGSVPLPGDGDPQARCTLHQQRMERFVHARLYVVTSRGLSAGRRTEDVVRMVLAAGVRLIQLREKELALREFVALAERVRLLTAAAGALLVINDRLDVALAVGADGVHLGQEDLPVAAARRAAPELIIGASTHNLEEALRAQADGASYINIGPVFPTSSKADWSGGWLGVEGVRAIASRIRIPYTVMGGIKREHLPLLRSAGVTTVAVITAVTAAPDPGRAARELLAALNPDTPGPCPVPP